MVKSIHKNHLSSNYLFRLSIDNLNCYIVFEFKIKKTSSMKTLDQNLQILMKISKPFEKHNIFI